MADEGRREEVGREEGRRLSAPRGRRFPKHRPQKPPALLYAEDFVANLRAMPPELHSVVQGRIYLWARCHPAAGVNVSYMDGEIRLACNACDSLVFDVVLCSKKHPRPR